MKFLILVFISFTLFLQASSLTVNDPSKDIQYFKLENGLEVYLLSDPKAESTQIDLEVKVGMDIENNENAGISHLVEHIVFRDQRVPYHDYLDYIKEEGATYINAYTRRYTTAYMATIDANKSYWITEIFAQMLFDKNVTREDLEIEKGALQTEIGEPIWYQRILFYIQSFLIWVTPTAENFYKDTFSLSQAKDLAPLYYNQENNPKFTLEEVMAHYDEYYYPSNMRLQIAGDFDIQKMKILIKEKYGRIRTTGTKTTQTLPDDASLNNKPLKRYFEGASENSGYIGFLYLFDDCKTHIIIDAYMDNLAQRIQQELRNKKGKTYSVNSHSTSKRGGAVASIYFDGLRDDFESNVAYIQKMIKADKLSISDKEISKALKSYHSTYYTAIEHDSDTLMGLLSTSEHLRTKHDINNSTHYQLFASITIEEFRKVVNKNLVHRNSYMYINRDYYFFPHDTVVIELLGTLLFILLYFNILRTFHFKRYGKFIKREIRFSRRVSNRFMSFLVFVWLLFLSTLLWEWSKYLFSFLILGDPYYLYTIDVPYSYLVTLLDMVFSIGYFILLYRWYNYQISLEVFDNHLYIMGSQYRHIKKSDILSFEITKRKEARYKYIIGTNFFFWRPLLKMQCKEGKVYYFRTNNAQHLLEDLSQWHEKNSE